MCLFSGLFVLLINRLKVDNVEPKHTADCIEGNPLFSAK